MDYEFRCNTLEGRFHAEFSMEHEAIGRWLLDELGTLDEDIAALLENLNRVMKEGGEWGRAGKVFHLQINQEEALIQANALFEETGDLLLETDFHVYDEEHYSLCGLEDFLQVIEAWQDFLCRYGRFRNQPQRFAGQF